MSLIFTPQVGYNQIGMTGVTTSVSTPRMATNGLIVFLDAANPKSYVSGQTTWNDMSGRGYHFNLTGSTAGVRPTYSGDNYGYINFNQTSSNFTWAERTQNFPGLSTYTVEIWVKFNSSVSGTSSVITSVYSTNVNFSIGYNSNNNRRLIYGGRFTPNGWANTDAGFVPSLEEWYQLILTFDGSLLTTLYINSELYSSGESGRLGLAGPGGLRIARRWNDSVTSTNMTDISVSVVRIYNRVLTQEEIKNNYNSLRYRYYQKTPSVDYILDSYSGAVVAYSLRKLKSTYSGPALKVRRGSDDAKTDIYFNGKDLDTNALNAFLTGGTIGFVDTWYDQSGNGNNATGDTINQPIIKTYDILYGNTIIRGKSSLFYGSTFQQTLTLKTPVTNANSVFMVLEPYDQITSRILFLGSSTVFDYYAGTNGIWLGSDFSAQYVQYGTNYLNGLTVDLTLVSRDIKPYYLTMLHTSPNGRFNRISQDRGATDRSWYGKISELIVYSGNQKSNRLSIEKNISDYYSIFPF